MTKSQMHYAGARLAVTAAFLCASAGAAAAAASVQTPLGRITGFYCNEASSGWAIAAYLGIPYAKPPVGVLRLAAPVKYDKRYPPAGLDATRYGPRCFQEADGDTSAMSEDCLFLNVWVPDGAGASNPLPVHLFIHGGAYLVGAGSEKMYDGCRPAYDGNNIVVTINYRLGAFGFMARPELADPNAGGAFANWGLLDQRLALQWVQDNIAAFGGDPARVVLTGESAGAYSLLLQMVSPGSRGLFSGIVGFSGSSDVMAVDFETDGVHKGGLILEKLKCSGLDSAATKACVRARDASTVLKAQIEASYDSYAVMPVVDGLVIPEHPSVIMQKGGATNVSVVLGANAREGALETVLQTGINEITSDRFWTVLTYLFPIPDVFKEWVYLQYNASYWQGSWLFSAILAITDAGYHCPQRRAAKYFAKQGIATRYFILQASKPNSGCSLYAMAGERYPQEAIDFMDAYHGYDGPFTWLAPYRSPYKDRCPFTPAEAQLASILSGIVSGMATSGSPVPLRSATLKAQEWVGLQWPAWTDQSNLCLNIDTATGPALFESAQYLEPKCKLWDELLALQISQGTSFPVVDPVDEPPPKPSKAPPPPKPSKAPPPPKPSKAPPPPKPSKASSPPKPSKAPPPPKPSKAPPPPKPSKAH